MLIKLSPARRDDSLSVIKDGDVLTINGVEYDFSPIPEGATLPASAVECEYVMGTVERIDGEINITLLFPIPQNYSDEQAFPADLVDVPDGDVAFPQPLSE